MSISAIMLPFLMGLTGSLHCAGMCGPIIWIMPFQGLQPVKKWLAISLYHLGRISIYALLAIILHSFKSFFQPQVQQYVSIVLGALLLILGILSFLPGKQISIHLPWTQYMQAKLGKFITSPSIPSLFIAGMLNGLLPCGLVYMALSTSMVASSVIQSASIMYAFGLGTTPMLIVLTVFKSKVRMAGILKFRKMVPFAMFLFGVLFMLRGMNLGIPYLSPKVAIEQNEVKASCCHKPE